MKEARWPTVLCDYRNGPCDRPGSDGAATEAANVSEAAPLELHQSLAVNCDGGI